MNKPTFTDYLKMAPEEQASHAGHFAALNETPVLDLNARWNREGWIPCSNCDGEGHYLYEPAEAKHTPDVWKNDNGTWSHRKDHNGEFSDKSSAQTDLRFALEWERAQ